MGEVLDSLDRIPGMKTKVFGKLQAAEQSFEDQKGYEGIQAGEKARRRLDEKKKTMQIN